MPYANALRHSYGYAVCRERALRPWFTRPPYVHDLRPYPTPMVYAHPTPYPPMPYAYGRPYVHPTHALRPRPTLYVHPTHALRPSPLPMRYAQYATPTPTPKSSANALRPWRTHVPYAHALRPCLHSAHCPRQQHRLGRRVWAERQGKYMKRENSNMYL